MGFGANSGKYSQKEFCWADSKQNGGIHPPREIRDTTLLPLMLGHLSKAQQPYLALFEHNKEETVLKKIHFLYGRKVGSLLCNNGKINYFSIRWNVLINSRQRTACDVVMCPHENDNCEGKSLLGS